MTKDQALHEFVCLGCRMRVILWEITEDDDAPYTGRERAILTDLEKLLKDSEQFKPNIEQLKEWETAKREGIKHI
jgi:hypothetical protein